MNITELARRLRVTPEELRQKLPVLGFDIGRKAIKVDQREGERIIRRWQEFAWRQKQLSDEKAKMELRRKIQAGEVTADRKISLPPSITIRELADKLQRPATDVIRELMKGGILASINERIDFDTAAVTAEDLGYQAVKESETQKEETVTNALETLKESVLNEDDGNLKPRPPVVVVMGHVDHGKTTLLDTIRTSAVAKDESGGITQHIGAYQAEKNGRKITFIDTPGHEAFTMMRSRGARVADVAILVVAADDGVQPQTVEVVRIIEAAKLPYVVAINKMDKADANPDQVKRQLSDLGMVPEDWGGKTVMVPISAKSKQGIDNLLETILLVADLEKDKIRANPERRAIGTIIESHVDKGEGPVATVLIQGGTLKKNDVAGIGGVNYGRVRAMKDFTGENVDEAPPGMPVKILGFKLAPTVGDVLEVPERAKDLKDWKAVKHAQSTTQSTVSTSSQSSSSEEGSADKQWTNVIIRADVLGSLEAIMGSLERMTHPEVGVKVVGKGLGNITDADVLSAEATGAMLLGFHVAPTTSAASLANTKDIPIRQYKVIYDLLNDVKEELKKNLKAEVIRTDLGKLEIRGVFKSGKDGQIVGGIVTDGKIERGAMAQVFRAGEPIASGKISDLQSQKQSVKEVFGGQECGIRFEGKGQTIALGDVLEVFSEEKREKQLGF
ncbi:MAG: translation initiation factor IF-2 [Patescibacteria group bacterium]|nr:MAG: translation initiation factor IF-2 [Patescibacteria group bacterium]